MFRGRWMLFWFAAGLLNMWLIADGFLTFQKDTYKCAGLDSLTNTGYYKAVDKQLLFSFWRLHWYYQPYTYGCDPDHRYDPSKYQIQNGEIVPRDNAN